MTQILTQLELKFCAGLNPTRGVSEINDGKDLTKGLAGNKAKRFSLVNHIAKMIHHHNKPNKYCG